MRDTFDLHKWKTYQMFLNESDDDFEFTDTDKDLAAGLDIKELTVGDTITPDMWNEKFYKEFQDINQTIERIKYDDADDGAEAWTDAYGGIVLFKDKRASPGGFYLDDLNGFLKSNYKIVLPDNLDEQDDDFEFTDIDKDLANKLNKELKVGSIITPNMWDKEALERAIDYFIAADSSDLAEKYKELLKKSHKISGLFKSELIPNSEDYYKIVFTNGTNIHSSNLEPEFNVFESLQENDDFEFTDADKNLAMGLGIKELTIGDTIMPDMWIDVFKKGETLKKYEIKSLKSSPHKITNIEVIGDDRVLMFGEIDNYYYTNDFLKPQYRVVLPDDMFESEDDFEFTDVDKDLAAGLDIIELTVGDIITPDMYAIFSHYNSYKFQHESSKILWFDEDENRGKIVVLEYKDKDYTNKYGSDFRQRSVILESLNSMLKPQYQVVIPDDFIKLNEAWTKGRRGRDISVNYAKYLDEQDDDFEFTDTDRNLAASMYADKIVSKYDVIIDIDQEVDVRLKKPLTDDFILKLLKRPLSLEHTSIECTISVSNRMALSDLLNYLNISEDVYSQWITPNLELDAGLAEENLNDLVDETISTHVHSLWDDNFEEGDFQINNVVIDYSEMSDDVLRLAKSDAFRKALNRSVIEQIMSPSFYSRGQENIFADYVHYDWDVRVVPNTLNESDDFEFTDIDKDLATGLDIKELTIGDIITPDMIDVPQDKRTWNNWHKILGDPKREGWKINSLNDEFVYLKYDSIIHPFQINKINDVLKPSYKIFPPDDLDEQDDDFEFTSTDKDLASSLADDVILEPGYVFNGDEIKDDKALRARLTGKTIARYYTRKSPLLNSSDQIMMDIKDVSGKEIQYVLSKLKPNYFIPDEVYDLKLGEEYK